MAAPLADQVAALEKRADSLEQKVGGGGAVGDAATVRRLEALMKVIEEDRAEAEAVAAERDRLRESNEKLEEKLAKANYRIEHLLRALADADEKKK